MEASDPDPDSNPNPNPNPAGLSRRALLLAILLYVLVRSVYVAAAADVFQYGEELEKGTAAKALLDGIAIPYHQKAYHLYEGGGFVVSHLKALCFLVAGESVLAHKLAALVTGALVLAAGIALLARHFGRYAAISFALVFTFGPESFQKLSLLSLGIHFEAGLFVLVVLDRAMRLAFERRPAASERRDALVLGLASGFGFYFDYLLALFVGAAGLLLLVRRRDVVFGRAGVLGVVGLVLGLAPLLWMAAHVGGAVFDIHGNQLAGFAGNFERIGRFLVSTLAGGLVDVARGWVWALALLVLVPFALRDPLRARFGFLAAVLVLWCVVYVSSGFVISRAEAAFGYMRLMPPMLLALVLLAAAIGRGLEGSPRARLAATGALFVALSAGLFASAHITAEGNLAAARSNLAFLNTTKGYDYFGWAAKVLPRLEGSPREVVAPLLGFDEPDPGLVYSDVAAAAARTFYTLTLAETIDLFAAIDPTREELARSGMGRCIARGAGRDLAHALTVVSGLPPAEAARFAEAAGREGMVSWYLPAQVEYEIGQVRGLPLAPAYLAGVGRRAFRRWVLWPYGGPAFLMKPAAARRWLEERGADAAPHLVRGFDEAREAYRLRR